MDIDESDFVHDEIRDLGREVFSQAKALRPAETRPELIHQAKLFGPSKESLQLLRQEEQAASQALQTGVYAVYRNESRDTQDDCFRIGPSTNCFCGHPFRSHHMAPTRSKLPRCSDCTCAAFSYIPASPAEIGEHWLMRRKGFELAAWFPKCECGHGPRQHDPTSKRCKACARCFRFRGAFACVACDGRYEDHATVFETAVERQAQRRTVGEAFRPLFDEPELRTMFIAPPAPTAACCLGCGSSFPRESSKFCSQCGRRR